MHVYEAEKIINQYGKALAECKTQFRPLSLLLNSSKQLVIDATKIYMAYMIKHPILDKEQFNQLMLGLQFLNFFIPDNEASRINKIAHRIKHNKNVKSSDAIFYDDYRLANTKKMQDSLVKYHESVVNYVNALNQEDSNSPSYCKIAYKLANVDYKPEYEDDFE